MQIPEWIKGRQHVVVLNREDCVRAEERRQWEDWYVALVHTAPDIHKQRLGARAAVMCAVCV